MKHKNLEMLGNVAAVQAKHQRYMIAAGDLQNQPKAIVGTDFPHRSRLKLIAPAKATCIMKKSSSTIDYFLMSTQ